MKRLIVGVVIAAVLAGRAAGAELIRNGSFEALRDSGSTPAAWQSAGDAAIKQQLSSDGGRCAKLECTHFEGNSPGSHVMLCQVGAVSVTRGQWYRLTFWAKAGGLKRGAIEIALSNTRVCRWRSR